MKQLISFLSGILCVLFLGLGDLWSQTYMSNWIEQGKSNKIDSVRIEVDNNKITFLVPKENGSILIFKGELSTDLNSNSQQIKAKLKDIALNVEVSPEYLQTLKAHSPRLVAEVKEGNETIEFDRGQVKFYAPMTAEANTAQNDYDYQLRNVFDVQRTWEIKPKAFAFRQLIDSDSHYGVGLLCGLADGLLEDVNMVISVGKFFDQNTWIIFGDMQIIDAVLSNFDQSFRDEYGFLLPKEFSAENTAERAKQLEIAKVIAQYVTDTEKLSQLGSMMYTEMGNMISEWFDETIGNNTPAIAGYQHGKIMYGVITMLVGVKEISLLFKGGDATLNFLKILRKMACFTGDTKVLTNNGPTSINQLHLGVLTNSTKIE